MSADRKWLFLALGAVVVELAGAEVFYFLRGGGGAGSTAQGVATLPLSQTGPTGAVLQVQGRVIHLTGLASSDEAKLAELAAGKQVRCQIRQLPRDERNWGVCRTIGSGTPMGDRLEDTINGRILLAGWALPNEVHGREWVEFARRAQAARAGMWSGNIPPDGMRTGLPDRVERRPSLMNVLAA